MTLSGEMWQRLKLRLEGVAYKQGGGCAQVGITLLVVDGELIGWSAPDVTVFEPYAKRESVGEALALGCESVDRPNGK